MTYCVAILHHAFWILNVTNVASHLTLFNFEPHHFNEAHNFIVRQLNATRVSDARRT